MLLEFQKDCSLLEVISKNGINLSFSCKVGGCVTCGVKAAEGKLIHFQSFFTIDVMLCFLGGRGI
jgi:dimethylamine monooxygenase subunit B